jgi:hypothetical protein
VELVISDQADLAAVVGFVRGYVAALIGQADVPSRATSRALNTKLRGLQEAMSNARRTREALLRAIKKNEAYFRALCERNIGDGSPEKMRQLQEMTLRVLASIDTIRTMLMSDVIPEGVENFDREFKRLVAENPLLATHQSVTLKNEILAEAAIRKQLREKFFQHIEDLHDMCVAALRLIEIEHDPDLLVTGATLERQLREIRA